MAETSQAPCDDCVPHVELSRGRTQDGQEIVVAAVAHPRSCPWMARVSPDSSAFVLTPYGLVIHAFAEEVDSEV